MSRYHLQNFGCRATQADGTALERQFQAHGLCRASAAEADIVVLNTCTVTESADQDARAAIRRVRRQNPQARIVVTGCYAQRAPQEISSLPGVSCVVGNSHKHQLADLVLNPGVLQRQNFIPLSSLASTSQFPSSGGERLTVDHQGLMIDRKPPAVDGQGSLYVSDIFAHTELLAAPVFEALSQAGDRTRPNLKVQDGCNNRCSFCVIPSVRGHSRSLAMERVIDEVIVLVEAGYRELVISGINLGRWGRDLPGVRLRPRHGEDTPRQRRTINGQRWRGAGETDDRRLVSLIRAILDRTPLEKLRISSVEPMDWTDDLIALVASSSRIARHAHVPLQSGSDAVLRRMHRKYRPWHYRDKIEMIHSALPTAAIGADVMVGFPGETDAEFESTRSLIQELPFTYLHVFTFSARPGTPAATMPKQVPVRVARERNEILRHLAAEKKKAFMQSFVGKQLEAITLGCSHAAFPDSSPEHETVGPKPPFPANSFSSTSEYRAAEDGSRASSEAVFTEALTDNYQKLFLRGRHASNRWMRVQIEDVIGTSFVGTPGFDFEPPRI